MNKILYLILFSAIILSNCGKKTSDGLVDKAKKMADPHSWRNAMPEAGPARSIEIGDYNSFVLDNGLQVIVVENHKLPRVSYQLSFNHDALVEGEEAGYVSIAGQLLKTGTKHRTKAEIDEAVDFLGASLNTSSGGIFASSLTKHQSKLLDIMTEVLYKPSFPVDEFEKIKKQTLSGIASSKTNPNAMAGNVSQILRYGKGHPYGEVQTEETVDNIKLESCKNFYKKYFKPNNAFLVIVGDITPAQATNKAKKYFGNWKRGDIPQVRYPQSKAPEGAKVAFVNKDGAVQSVINISYPLEYKPGNADVIKASVMNTILGGGFASRLNQNLREDKAYTYGARTNISTDKLTGSFTASASVRNEVTDSSMHEFLYELNRIKTSPVEDKEFMLAKNYMAGNFARSLESPQSIARFALNTFRYNLPKDYYNTYLSKLEAVTKVDVMSMAKKYINPENAHLVVVGSKDDVAKTLERFDTDGKIDYYDAFGNEIKMDDTALPSDVTAQSVVEDYIEAIGGKDKLNAVNTMRAVMGMEVMGQQAEMVVSQSRPMNFAMKLSMQGMTMQEQVFDGTKMKTGQMGQNRIVTEGPELAAMKEQAGMFGQMNYTTDGTKLELKGIDNVEGKKAYKLAVVSPSEKKTTEYYSITDGLLIRSVSSEDGPQGPGTITTDFADYKEVGGVMIPHTTIITGAMPVPLKAIAKTIEINQPIPAGTFKIE